VKLGNLAQRLLFAFVAGPVFLWATWFGGWARWIQLGFIVVAASWEAARLIRQRYPKVFAADIVVPTGVGLTLALGPGGPWQCFSHLLPLVWVLTLLAVVLTGFRRFAREEAFAWIALQGGVFSFFAFSGRIIFMLASWDATPGARGWVSVAPLLWAALGCWAGDTGAYAVGKLFGKHKLCPELSPAKTVEGALGALVATAIFSLFWAPNLLGWSIPASVVAGLALAVCGILGDLLESSAKRWAGVKDSSHIFPGHGGVYDRFDSLFLSAPVLWAVFVALR